MKILEVTDIQTKTKYTVYGTNLILNSNPNGDDSVKLDNIEIYKNGELITDFGVSFVGLHEYTKEEAATSLILAYINKDNSFDSWACEILGEFAFEFARHSMLITPSDIRWVPKKYLTIEHVLNLQLVTKDGFAFYDNGDEYVMTRPDGSVATDMEVFYGNAFAEAIEDNNYLFVTDEIIVTEYFKEES